MGYRRPPGCLLSSGESLEGFTVAVRAFKVLWPDEADPRNPQELAKRLIESETRLSQWRESAARAGADEAMMVVLSWYEGLDFNLFQTYRSNGKYVSEPAWVEKRKKLAYSFIEFADIHKFVDGPSYLNADADAEEEEGEEGEDDEETDEEQIDEETKDAAKSKANDVIPPSSTEATGSDLGNAPKADAPPSTEGPSSAENPTLVQAPERDLGKAPVIDE